METESGKSAAERLAAFVAGSSWRDIAPSLRHQGRRALLNMFAGALRACRDPAVETAAAVLAPFSGPARTALIGRRERLDAMGAGFVNAVAANFLDFDDTHFPTAIHPTAPIAPPVLALAEERGLPGAAALHAVILGMEVACRIGLAVSPGHYARGWHITSTCGVFGAAAGCAKLLGLDAAATAAALEIAASQSAGLVENLPTAAKNVSVGDAARNGLFAALLAQRDYRGSPCAIEGPFGWARAMGDEPDLERMLSGLGERWETAEVAFKPYPAGFVFHAEIDACLQLRTRLGPEPGRIREVVVRGDQLLLDRGERPVASKRDARVSIQHAAAVAFVRGRAGVEDFDEAAVVDPALAAFRQRVRSELDPALPTAAASVTATLTDGRTATVTVRDARGSPANPMSDADLEAKFADGFRTAGLTGEAVAAAARVWSIDTAGTVGDLMGAMSA